MNYTLDELSNINYNIERLLTGEGLGLKIYYNPRIGEYQWIEEPTKRFWDYLYIKGLDNMLGLPLYLGLEERFDLKTGQIKEKSIWSLSNEIDGQITLTVDFKNLSFEAEVYKYGNGSHSLSWEDAKNLINRHIQFAYVKLTTVDFIDTSDLLIHSDKQAPEFF